MMLANNKKATLQAIHSDAVNKAVKDQKEKEYSVTWSSNDSEKDLTRKERIIKIRILQTPRLL